MRNTILLLLAFLLLGGAATWYLTSGKEQQKRTITSSDRDFAVEDKDDIYRVFIVQPDGETVDLKRQENHWTYNDAYRANPIVINGILEAASRLEISYPVTKSLESFVVKSFTGMGIKVELYGKDGDKLKGYYIGGESNDQEATYYIMEGSNTPYAVSLPGWAGVLRVRFAYKGNDWRDKTIFAENRNEITEIKCEYPTQKSASFILKKEEGRYSVKPFYETTPIIQEPVQQGRVEGYLLGFKKLKAESFASDIDGRDSISQTVPFCNFSLTDDSGKVTKVQFFPIRRHKNSGDLITDEQVSGSTSIERYYARVVPPDDFMMVQHRVFGKIFTSYESFFE